MGAVKTRQGDIRKSDRVANARATRFWERRRSRHLLSGLLYCQECGSRYASIGRDYLACSAARGSGTCSNRQSIRRVALEGLIINGLRQRLMAPELVEEFVRAVQKEINLQRREDDALRDGRNASSRTWPGRSCALRKSHPVTGSSCGDGVRSALPVAKPRPSRIAAGTLSLGSGSG
jgi:hypothetical protein